MASLKKNGLEVARFDGFTNRISYRTTGAVLKNVGGGWKHLGKIPVSELNQAVSTEERNLAAMPPEYHEFRREWFKAVPFEKRGILWEMFRTMHHDPDALSIELADSYSLPRLSCDELQKLSWSYAAWLAVRETMPFAVVVQGNTIAAVVCGPLEFRREIAKRERSKLNPRDFDRRVITRLASQTELNLHSACGNRIETPSDANSLTAGKFQ